ncbi:hypothetical protein ABZ942_13305 [Nocardia sp. NPDC046473]|uniref:hypothetical protein n=1 Tax=Nocardia sp. NPDC046473 TaxID=3155733 RepID=UPI0033E565B2
MNSQNRISPQPRGEGVALLASVRAAFEVIAADPVPPPLEQVVGRPVGSWNGLRELLCYPGLPPSLMDKVWAWLVRRARPDAQDAVLVCAGLALPMLGGMARRFGEQQACDSHDVAAHIVAAFLIELARIDLDRPGVWPRLRWAAYVGGRAWVSRETRAALPTEELTIAAETIHGARPHPSGCAPSGHPELLLVQAVAEGVISAGAAELIAVTRLEARSLTAVAVEWGEPYKRLEKRRSRAERQLADWLKQRLADADPRNEVEAQALDAAARTTRGHGTGVSARPVSQSGLVPATTSHTRTTPVPAYPAPVEVTRRCA